MKFAIIKTGGKQYKVQEGDRFKVEKLELPEGEKTIIFEEVLFVADDDKLTIGRPFVEGVKVTAELVKQGRSKKVTILKYKPKVRYRIKRGHRQPFTEIKIAKIGS